MPQWVKGQSGNPAGRSKSAAELTEIARSHCGKALEVILKCLESDKEETRLRAAGMMMDRGLGGVTAGTPLAALTDEELARELALRREVRLAEPRRTGDGVEVSHDA